MATSSKLPPPPPAAKAAGGSKDPLSLLDGGDDSYDAVPHNASSKWKDDSYEYDGTKGGDHDDLLKGHNNHFGPYGYGDGGGDDDGDWRDFDDYDDGSGWSWSSILLLTLLLSMLLAFCWSQRHAMLNAWHRRQARLAFPKTATMDGETSGGATAEMKPVSTWFGTTSVIQVTIEVDGIAHKIGASRETFGQCVRTRARAGRGPSKMPFGNAPSFAVLRGSASPRPVVAGYALAACAHPLTHSPTPPSSRRVSRAARRGLTQLPFALTDACAESGFPELQSLDIVDLCISKRAELRFESCRGGAPQLVDAHTTVDDVMMAKAFHVKVLPASPA